MLDEMQVVAVADLPWPHNPSKCAHIDRFNAVRGVYDESFAGHIPAGAHFFLSLDAGCFAACAYHQHDWLAIAAASVDLLAGLPPGSDRDDVLSAAADLLPAGPDRLELGFLFSPDKAGAAMLRSESPANSGPTPVARENRPERVVSSAVMTERQSSEVEKVLLHIGDARSRARRAAEACAQDGADAHIVAALTDAELQLAELHRKLSQGTYYAVPDKSLKLAV